MVASTSQPVYNANNDWGSWVEAIRNQGGNHDENMEDHHQSLQIYWSLLKPELTGKLANLIILQFEPIQILAFSFSSLLNLYSD
jgi:hypothetical protein